MTASLNFKLSLAKASLKTCFLTNMIANGAAYYFLSRGAAKTLSEFAMNALLTAFILSLICCPCAQLMANGMEKKGALDVHTYDRNDHMLLHFFPKGRLGQTLFSAILVTLVFGTLECGVAVLTGFGAANQVPLIAGTIIHGVCAGLMGLANMYLGYVGRFTTLRAARPTAAEPAEG